MCASLAKGFGTSAFSHFQYTRVEERKEQVRRPARSWKDRKDGIDCDCFTVLIGSILTNLGIPFKMRMTRYQAADFEHIYPVAETPNGEEIIIDCVVHRFNYEVPYTQKKDEKMELQYLNGVKQERFNEFGDKVYFENDLPIDAQDLFLDEMELTGLDGRAERLARKKRRRDKRKAKRAEREKLSLKEKLKRGLKKGLNVINKVNPAAMLLRAGVLASMKLNVFKVASHLRFAYWSTEEAIRNNMDMNKFNQLQRIREKLEKIYFGAGGKTSALKKAILQGKGNKNRMVQLNGLGSVIANFNDEDDLRTIIGEDIFFEELDELELGEELDGLGSISLSAAIASASGFIATISTLIKKLGRLFKKGSPEDQKVQIQNNTDDEEEKTRKFSFKNIKAILNKRKVVKRHDSEVNIQREIQDQADTPPSDYQIDARIAEDFSEDDNQSDDEKDNDNKTGVGQWIKDNPVKTGLIGLGVGTGIYLIVKASKKSKTALSGTPKKKYKPRSTVKKQKTIPKKRSNGIKTVELG
ncbi:MAG: hypothetical protein JKY09_04135 [Crocinitomicaceae bacterium]|nr:hypothetical protein [Crocinitomicaceae bacterium]